jgi:hypothetical protein
MEPDADTAPEPQPYPGAAEQSLHTDAPPPEYFPAPHKPEHVAVVSAVASPKEPGRHGRHAVSPATLYTPTPHASALRFGVVEPGGHA